MAERRNQLGNSERWIQRDLGAFQNMLMRKNSLSCLSEILLTSTAPTLNKAYVT